VFYYSYWTTDSGKQETQIQFDPNGVPAEEQNSRVAKLEQGNRAPTAPTSQLETVGKLGFAGATAWQPDCAVSTIIGPPPCGPRSSTAAVDRHGRPAAVISLCAQQLHNSCVQACIRRCHKVGLPNYILIAGNGSKHSSSFPNANHHGSYIPGMHPRI
jgi:hypothetical protein